MAEEPTEATPLDEDGPTYTETASIVDGDTYVSVSITVSPEQQHNIGSIARETVRRVLAGPESSTAF